MAHLLRYEITVAGRGGDTLLAALDGFQAVPSDPGETRLVGWVEDQAALHSALERLRDLHVELKEVRRLPEG